VEEISGDKSTDDHIEREQCSRVHLDAITSDDAGSVQYMLSEVDFLLSFCLDRDNEFLVSFSGYIITPVDGSQ